MLSQYQYVIPSCNVLDLDLLEVVMLDEYVTILMRLNVHTKFRVELILSDMGCGACSNVILRATILMKRLVARRRTRSIYDIAQNRSQQ